MTNAFEPRSYIKCGILFQETGEYRTVGPDEPYLAQNDSVPALPYEGNHPLGSRIILKAVKVIGGK